MTPHTTPRPVKVLIWITSLATLLSPIFTFMMMHYFKAPGPGQWFSLSLWGIKEGWVWQPLTYFFIHSAGIGISLSLLISLSFHMLFLWFAGAEINTRYGTKSFLLFYFGAGIFSGLVALITLLLFSSASVVVGSGPCVYALLMVWTMIYPDLEISLLLFLRIKAKWLIAILLGILLLMSLSYGQFIPFLADLAGIIWGFAIGRIAWKLPNPFSLNLQWKKPKKSGKIIDITVFQEDDDAFMDRMLDKIAKKGKESLSKRERDRMEKISKKRRK